METSLKKVITTTRRSKAIITHLVRPSTSRQSYWQYFGFPADKLGTIINRQHIFCTLCNELLIYNNSQNANLSKGDDLKMHLANIHPDIDEKMKITNELRKTVMITARQQKQQPAINVVSQPPQPSEKLPPTRSPLPKNGRREYQISGKSFQQTMADDDESIEYLIPEEEASSHIQSGHDEQDNETMAIDGEEYDDNHEKSINQDDGDRVINTKTVKDHHRNLKLEILDFADEVQQMDCNRNDEIFAENINNDSTIILEMFIQDLLPLTLIDGEGFRYFCQQQIKSPLSIENSEQLEMELKELFNNTQYQFYQIIETDLNVKKYFSIGCDRWKNYQDKYFLTFTINYEYSGANGEYCKLKTLPLFTIPSNPVVLDTPLLLDGLLKSLNMDFCTGFITNFSLDLEKPLKQFLDKQNIRSIECFALIINRIGEKIVKEIIKPHLLNVDKYLEMNQEKIKQLNQISRPLKMNSYFWITVYDYLNYFKDIYQLISITRQKNNDEQLFNEINQIITLLAPLHMALTTMPEQKPLASVILPLVQQLIQHQFDSDDEDTILTKQIKELVKNEIGQHFFNNKFLIIASFLDPRFQHLTNKDDLKQLKIDLQELAPADSTTTSSPSPSESQIKTESKKSTNSGLSYFFTKQSDGRSSLIKQSQTKFDIELKSYLANAMADIEQCPLQWWSDHKNIYPNLYLIVDRFNCLPAFITPNLHQPLKQQILLFNNRFMMNELQMMDEILWLHGFKYGDSCSNQNICIRDGKFVDVGDKEKKTLNK